MEIKGLVRQIPRFLALLVNLLKDPRVSSADKAILATAVAYTLNPVDLVPDWIPFFGFVDDLYLVALALLRLFVRVDEGVLRENWAGPEDIIVTLKRALNISTRFLPPRLRRVLVEKVTDHP